MDLLETLSTLEEEAESGCGPLPVEYIPMVKNSVFFGDRHSLKSKYHSSLVLDA
jgi:hypothetical protein